MWESRLAEGQEKTPAQRRAAMTWTQRLKRVLGIDTCAVSGGALRITACIEDPEVIEKILDHLEHKNASAEPSRLPSSRAPP
jgi:hypothetical protein